MMAHSFAIFHQLFILLSFSIIFSSTAASLHHRKPKRFVTKLIRHDLVYSLHSSDWAMRAIKSSHVRFKYVNARINSSNSLPASAAQGDVIAQDNGSIFLVNVSIGNPPIPQLVAMDTGSHLLWVQCSPCQKCSPKPSPLFNPTKSSTYVKLSCHSSYCNDPISFESECHRATDHCLFSINYKGRAASKGDMGTEMLTLTPPDEVPTKIHEVVFGCGRNNDLGNGQYTGVLGLGYAKTSLVSKLGSKFSYCIGNIRDPKYSYNRLILGDGARSEGSPTPIDLFDGFYYVTVLDISVGQKRLNIKRFLFERDMFGNGGTIIDSGSTLNFLNPEAFVELKAEVRKVIGGLLNQIIVDDIYMLCYDGVVSRDLIGFPVVTFHLAGDTDLVLDINSMFWQLDPNIFCMATDVSETGVNTIGVLAQQNYNIGYDLEAKKLFFQMIDCQLLV